MGDATAGAAAGPSNRSYDSWSVTEVRSISHSHVWTVKGFSQCEARYLETTVKPDQSDPNASFRLRLHPKGNKESNKDFSFFQVFNNGSNNNGGPKFTAKFSVFNVKNEELTTTVYSGQQQLHGHFEYVRHDLLVGHLAPEDQLQLVLNLTIASDTVTKSCYNNKDNLLPDLNKAHEVARDFACLYNSKKNTDFVIKFSDTKNVLKVHQCVLIARSPVFAAMLESHTQEASEGFVVLHDINYNVMEDVVQFMYSGKSLNLSKYASELLAAADRFSLMGLKQLADQFVRGTLMCDTVCRTLLLADMHDAPELKQECIKFIAKNSTQVIQTGGWSELIESHASLVTEVVGAISMEPPPPKTIRPSANHPLPMGGSEPPVKRSRN